MLRFFLITTAQKTLLRTLIGFIEDGKLNKAIAPLPASKETTQFVLHLRGEDSFVFKRISDLDNLCDAGLLRYSWNRQGTGKLYYVTKAGTTAVNNDFQTPTMPFRSKFVPFTSHRLPQRRANHVGQHYRPNCLSLAPKATSFSPYLASS